MKRMVRTIVRMTTRVPPKLRASSRRKVESNNIVRLFTARRIMDFAHRVAPAQGLGKIEADALVLVVAAGALDSGIGAPLAALLGDAVAQGDLALTKGKSLYLHRPPGFAARRVVVSVAADTTAKSFKAAVAQAFTSLKGGGAKSLAVAWGGASPMS